MRDAEFNAKIKQAYSNAVPDTLNAILSDCSESGKQKGQVDGMDGERKIQIAETKEKRKRNGWAKYVSAAAACLLLIAGGAFGLQAYHANYTAASIVSLDVNPSVEIIVNEKDRVLEVKALNEDGRIVVGDMDFSGSSIDVAVNALIGSMLQNGYLSDIANSILISVDDDDPNRGAALKERVAKRVNEILQADGFSGAVLSQTITKNGALQEMAEKYGITLGKAQLIQEILDTDAGHTFEELAPLTINELNLLVEAAPAASDNIISVGNASDKSYIGENKAKEIALADAGLSAADITAYKVKMDTERGVMVYEIDFKSGGFEYEYDIDAVTGEIVQRDKETDDDYTAVNTEKPAAGQGNQQNNEKPAAGQENQQNSEKPAAGQKNQSNSGNASELISMDQAKEIALNHAGLSAASVTFKKAELDRDDGMQIYEIEFISGNTEYEYDIDASTGTVLKYDQDMDENQSNSGNTSELISMDQAKEIALNHAGLSAASVTFDKAELDRDDGMAVYEIEFISGNTEYEYDIDASSGAVIKYEQDTDD